MKEAQQTPGELSTGKLLARQKKVSFGNLEWDDGSWTTSWKESAELLLERFFPIDEEDACDGSHQHIRELAKSYQNCNVESSVTREDFDNLWWPSILLRLIKVGISSYIFDTLKDYFSGGSVSLMAEDRSMMVSREAERGCPQGSIVDPYALRWCMDELLNDARWEWPSETVEWVAYADNIVIAVKGNSRLD